MNKTQNAQIITLLIVIGIVVSSGCTQQKNTTEEKKKDLTTIKVGLSWLHEAQFAGLYWADQKGLYGEEGLKVEFYPYNYTDLAQDLTDGKYDFVILQTDTLLQAKEAGLPVKAVYADYQIIPTCYYSRKGSGITKPNDLIGKNVGVAYSERYPLLGLLKRVGINASAVNIIDRDYVYEPLANGTYDVEAGWVTDGDLVKKVAGEYNVIHPYDYGVNWYADVITTTDGKIADNPDVVGKFIKATAKGWENAIEHSDEAALLTLNYTGEEIQQLTPEHLKFVLDASSPLIHTGEQHMGWMESQVFEDTQDMLLEHGVMKRPINVSDAYTLQFLKNAYGE